jgi:hypothetical protein
MGDLASKSASRVSPQVGYITAHKVGGPVGIPAVEKAVKP